MSVPRTSRLADFGRGLLTLAGVVLVVGGVPLALATWVGWPLPAAVPAPSEVADALRDTYIPDEFLVKALAVVCWLVWLELVASLLVEAVAYARGRKAGRVPLAGGLQRGAARLVAGVALLGAVFATRGVPEPASLAGQPYHPLVRPAVTVTLEEAPVPPPGLDDVATTPDEEAPTYLVQRRDTLWDIAERHLGDPFRWQEIFLINEGCPQADGGCLTDPDLIHPGWELRLPADAVGLAPPPAPEPPADPAAPADPAPESPSLAIEGGMVLIDDGRDTGSGGSGGGEAVLVSEGHGAATTHTFDGMVLLPSPDAGAEPVVAAPDREGEEGDEVASHAGPGAARPSTGRDE